MDTLSQVNTKLQSLPALWYVLGPVLWPVLGHVLGPVLWPVLGPVLWYVLWPVLWHVLGPVLGPVLWHVLWPVLGPVVELVGEDDLTFKHFINISKCFRPVLWLLFPDTQYFVRFSQILEFLTH